MGIGGDIGLHRNDRGSEPAFHVTGTTAKDLAVPDDCRKRIKAPAFARINDIDMRVEMHGRARARALPAGNNIGSRITVTVAGRIVGADVADVKT